MTDDLHPPLVGCLAEPPPGMKYVYVAERDNGRSVGGAVLVPLDDDTTGPDMFPGPVDRLKAEARETAKRAGAVKVLGEPE